MLGYTRAMSFNSRTHRLWPSDFKFYLFTMSIIIGPTAVAFWLIWTSDENHVDFTMKVGATVLVSMTLIACLSLLYRVAFTDPGILPAIHMNSGITNTEAKKADNIKEYYAQYKEKKELERQMLRLGITDPVQKYYMLNKFKYLSAATLEKMDT